MSGDGNIWISDPAIIRRLCGPGSGPTKSMEDIAQAIAKDKSGQNFVAGMSVTEIAALRARVAELRGEQAA